jgi:hypothetical protein
LPKVKNRNWSRQAIDYYVLAKLEAEGLSPAPRSRSRNAHSPPLARSDGAASDPPKRVDRFLADKAAGAYERVVDRLLASPRYGERMAFRWLDAARYADTNGYQIDGERSMWRWRDWVIEASIAISLSIASSSNSWPEICCHT